MFIDITLSVPPTLTVAEDAGTARVCVTVSTAIDIDISVTGADGKVILDRSNPKFLKKGSLNFTITSPITRVQGLEQNL